MKKMRIDKGAVVTVILSVAFVAGCWYLGEKMWMSYHRHWHKVDAVALAAIQAEAQSGSGGQEGEWDFSALTISTPDPRDYVIKFVWCEEQNDRIITLSCEDKRIILTKGANGVVYWDEEVVTEDGN